MTILRDKRVTVSAPRNTTAPTIWICSYLPRNRGAGVERFVDMIADIAQRSGWTPRIVDVSSVAPIGSLIRKSRYLVAWKIGRMVNSLALPQDIIVCNNFFSWNVRQQRSIVIYHGTDRGRATKNRRNMSLWKYLVVRTVGSYLESRTGRGRLIVAVSRTAKEEVEEYYRRPVSKVIPNAVDLSFFSPSNKKAELRTKLGLPQGKFLVLYVGTPDPRKGLGWILTSLKPRLGEDQHLVLRTDIDYSPPDVTLVKRLPLDLLADLYRACDVLVFPTSYEGCSFVLVESLASGLPVITSQAGSGRELTDDLTLKPYIVEGLDLEKYASRINKLASSQDEWHEVSRAARAFAERNHDIRVFERSYLEIMERLIKDGAPETRLR